MGPFKLAWDVKELAKWAQPEYDISSRQGPQRRNPSASPAAGSGETASAVGHVAGTLGPAPAATEEGSAVTEPVAVGLAAGKPTEAGEGPAAGGVGPWRTHDLKE